MAHFRAIASGRALRTRNHRVRRSIRRRLQPTLKIVEATAGFRVTPEVTLRGSFFTREFYGRTTWDRQAGVQAVWTRRWR
jgi:hypothetical protein